MRIEMGKRLPIIAVAILMLTLFAPNAMTQTVNGKAPEPSRIDADLAPWLFRAGDDATWKRVRLDEREWRPIEVPGNWHAQGFESPTGMGWYRAHLFVPASARRTDLSVALGRIFNADQAFFNGVPIGSEGRIDEQVVEAQTKTRVYPIPRGVIRYGQDNVLAVRVMNTRLVAGIVAGPTGIGNYSMLSMQAEGADSNIKIFQGMVIGLLVVLVLFTCFLYLNGLREYANRYFGLFLIVIAAATLLDSLYFYDLGLKSPLIQRVIYALNALAPAVLLMFVIAIIGGRLRLWEKAAVTVMACVSGLFLLPPESLKMLLPIALADQMTLIRLAWAGALVLGAMMIVRGLAAAYHGFSGGVMISIAVALPLVGGLLSEQPELLASGFDPILVGTVLMILLFLFAVAGRYFDLTQRLQALAQHMTNVQAMERQRLSRDLHDSLGQNLVSFQLNLKMAADKLRHPLLTAMLADIATAIRRLDDTLQGLHPVELAHYGLCQAIERHCRRVQEQTNIDIHTEMDCPARLPEKVKEHLFHIFQESLNNCVKHAQAEHVVVRISRQGGYLAFELTDDGAGFDAKSPPGQGLGMLTMRERANLIGARLAVESHPGKGTSIRVEAPLYD